MRYSASSQGPGNLDTAPKSPFLPAKQKGEIFRIRSALPTVTSVAPVAAGAIRDRMVGDVARGDQASWVIVEHASWFNCHASSGTQARADVTILANENDLRGGGRSAFS